MSRLQFLLTSTLICVLGGLPPAARAAGRTVTVTVTNPGDARRPAETVSVAWKALGADPADAALRVWDVKANRAVAWQDGRDGNLLFVTALEPRECRTFSILSDAARPAADQSVVCWSQFLPERMDDFAWENDRFGARAYGPAIMAPPPRGQSLVSSGIDIINKCVSHPVLHRWFTQRTGEGSYHKNHGEGMDNYKVATGRGCGGLGARTGKVWSYSSNWMKSRTLLTGPVRTQFELTYPAWGGRGVEVRRVTLDRGHDFARYEVFFRDAPQPGTQIGPGLDCSAKRQHNGRIVRDLAAGWIANWEPEDVDGKGNGTIGTGLLLDPAMGAATTATDGQGCAYLFPSRTDVPLVYWAGATWSGAGHYRNDREWTAAVAAFAAALRQPVRIEVK